MHDPEAAVLRLKTTPVDEKNVADVALRAYARALLAEEQDDLKAAALQWDAYAAAYADPTVATTDPLPICYAAVTYEKTGQPAKAQAALDAPQKAVGVGTFVDCYRFRGDVLDLRGDWAGAQEWYAKSRIARTQHSLRLLLLGPGAREARRPCRGRSQIPARQPEGSALGRSAESLGRCAHEAKQRQGRAREVRRGAQVRTELEAAQGSARGGGEAEDVI